ncbi:MAG: MFS transporter, partial [Microbacteriaceae bacterium]
MVQPAHACRFLARSREAQKVIALGLIGSIEGVLVFRALQGVSALLMPQTIALLRATFPREKFGMAVGIWGGVSSVSIAGGPLVSGLLVQSLGWEWVFYINVPLAIAIAIAGIVMAVLVIRETAVEKDGVIDILGIILLAGALSCSPWFRLRAGAGAAPQPSESLPPRSRCGWAPPRGGAPPLSWRRAIRRCVSAAVPRRTLPASPRQRPVRRRRPRRHGARAARRRRLG